MNWQVVAVLAGLAAASTAAGASLMAMGQVVDWASPAGLGAVFTAVGTAIGAGLAGYTGALRVSSRAAVVPGIENA